MSGRRPIPLTVLSGLDRQAVADVGAGLLLHAPRLALIWADPFTAELGYIQTRVTDSDGRCTERIVELAHGCLSCAMREGVVRAVQGLASTGRYDSIVVHLHPGIEADTAVSALVAELRGTAVVDTVVTVLNPDWLDVLASDATVADRSVAVSPDDERSVAMVLGSDIDVTTAVIFAGGCSDRTHVEEHAALSVLAPAVVRLYPPTMLDVDPGSVLCTGTPIDGGRDRLTSYGLTDPQLPLPDPSGDLTLVRWGSTRPLHPERLFDTLEELLGGVVRSTGYLWFATRPDLLIAWDGAGDCLQLGPDRLWDRSDGARSSSLGFLGDRLDAAHITSALDACALTDEELARSGDGCPSLNDPFPDWSEWSALPVGDIPDEGAA